MVKKSGYIFEPSLFKTDINAQFPLTFTLYLCNYAATANTKTFQYFIFQNDMFIMLQCGSAS